MVSWGLRAPGQPGRGRDGPFWGPFVDGTGGGGWLLCVFGLAGSPRSAWGRFGWWLAIGLVLYVFYDYRHSVLGKKK